MALYINDNKEMTPSAHDKVDAVIDHFTKTTSK